MLDDGPRSRATAGRDITPLHPVRAAMHAAGSREVGAATATGAREHGEPALRGCDEEPPGCGVDDGRSQAGTHDATRISAEVDGGGAELTRDIEASGTWLLEVPRI